MFGEPTPSGARVDDGQSAREAGLDRRQLLVITVVALPAMLVGVLVLMFADSGGSKATDLPGTEPVGWVSPPTFSATLLPTSDP